jgi:hypothetical protein
MSKALISFDSSIKDAEDLLAHFDTVNKKPPPENAEVLKRAGLIMSNVRAAGPEQAALR